MFMHLEVAPPPRELRAHGLTIEAFMRSRLIAQIHAAPMASGSR